MSNFVIYAELKTERFIILGNKEPYVGASLRILHSHFYLSDLHLDAMRECLEKVLKSQNMPQSLIRDIIWALEKERREVIYIVNFFAYKFR